jgi:hypothetical protein
MKSRISSGSGGRPLGGTAGCVVLECGVQDSTCADGTGRSACVK